MQNLSKAYVLKHSLPSSSQGEQLSVCSLGALNGVGGGVVKTLYAEAVGLHQRILSQETSIPKFKVKRKPSPGHTPQEVPRQPPLLEVWSTVLVSSGHRNTPLCTLTDACLIDNPSCP